MKPHTALSAEMYAAADAAMAKKVNEATFQIDHRLHYAILACLFEPKRWNLRDTVDVSTCGVVNGATFAAGRIEIEHAVEDVIALALLS